MKKAIKSVLGVTLLEIMLVLAIAAMIIVMSVRYYQSASANQQANGALQMIQGIAAAADSLAQGSGSYNGTGVTAAAIQTLMPNNSMQLPWGTTATWSGTSATQYTVTFPSMPAQVCQKVSTSVAGNPKIAVTSGACGTSGSGNFSYTYTSTN